MNWSGPIWFPVNFLIIESLQKFSNFSGDDFKVECPVGSGTLLTLNQVANQLAGRLWIFLAGMAGRRPVLGSIRASRSIRTSVITCFFTNTFTVIAGAGVGASHQTGWTGLVAKLLLPRYSGSEPAS